MLMRPTPEGLKLTLTQTERRQIMSAKTLLDLMIQVDPLMNYDGFKDILARINMVTGAYTLSPLVTDDEIEKGGA